MVYVINAGSERERERERELERYEEREYDINKEAYVIEETKINNKN